MKKFFNGYQFPGSRESLYNPQLSLDFLSMLQSGELSMERLKQVVDKMEKKLEVNAHGDGLVDPRSKASENVLALLAQSPALQIFDSFVSSETVNDCNTSKLTSYDLCDPIVSTALIDRNPTRHDELVSFLYYYGWATIAQQVDTNRFVFRIPNLLTKPLFLDHLLARVRLRIEDVTNFIDNPTEFGLTELLAPLLNTLKDEYWTNQVGEDSLQFLFQILLNNAVGSNINAEFEVKKTNARIGYVDIWLRSFLSNNGVIIEIKRLRLNAIDIPNFKPAKHADNWAMMKSEKRLRF